MACGERTMKYDIICRSAPRYLKEELNALPAGAAVVGGPFVWTRQVTRDVSTPRICVLVRFKSEPNNELMGTEEP